MITARAPRLLSKLRYTLASVMFIHSSAAIADPEVEIMHWWSSGGERAALQVFKEAFKGRGGIWYDSNTRNSVDTLNNALSRMAKGYSPTFVLWNVGWEVQQISEMGLVDPITDTQQLLRLESTVLDSVMDLVAVDGQIVAIPVNVHSNNWLWYLNANSTKVPVQSLQSWDDFLELARARNDAGDTVIAVGSESWQQRILFNSLLLGVAGKNVYQRFYAGTDSTVFGDPALHQALGTFTELNQYAKSFGDGSWGDQIKAVVNGDALTISMGDWAKGEFKTLGIEVGDQLACAPAPATHDLLIPVLDVFVRGRVENQQEREGQALFIDMVTDPAINQQFNALKGSLPPLKNLDTTTLDECSRIAHKVLQSNDNVVKPFASYGSREHLSQIEDLISRLWNQETSVRDTLAAFSALMEKQAGLRVSEGY